MRQGEPRNVRGLCLYILRSVRGWSQGEMAKALEAPASTISEYERGKRYVPERIVRHAATAVGVPARELLALETSLRDLQSAVLRMPIPRSDLRDGAAEELHLGFEDLARRVVERLLGSSPAWKTSSRSTRDLVPADVLWSEIERCGMEERFLIVEEGVEYQTWSFCKLLCEKSLAADGGAEALAGLALQVAERIPGDDDWRACVQAFAWAHLGRARWDRGDPAGAEQAFGRFRELWEKGASMRPLLLDDVRTADLEALAFGEMSSLR